MGQPQLQHMGNQMLGNVMQHQMGGMPMMGQPMVPSRAWAALKGACSRKHRGRWAWAWVCNLILTGSRWGSSLWGSSLWGSSRWGSSRWDKLDLTVISLWEWDKDKWDSMEEWGSS
eukprot:CAMPEP_0116950846 /NCGR_PEP_ID=MMETSP0467-20121206/39726_1 /TAXON_ID=283647 /ORGANISM="Mesodinium pulex, Strain SPMC105" /LENGTH=115 /DNA_ID=CAMNT_0004635697 /DNA_START=499 /DNA_END=844 /DNA_ORIENTATION=+